MPPIGSTRPRRLISPVIATSLRTGRSVSSEASATNIATPALGPSFGVAPAGTWTWMSRLVEHRRVDAERAARAFTSDSAACALSFITSPSWPVRISLPLPGMRVASMKRMSPPTGVHASPVATPGMPVRIATSASKRFGRRGWRAGSAAVIVMRSAVPSAMRTATWRQHAADLALEVAHAGLARVVVDDRRAARRR